MSSYKTLPTPGDTAWFTHDRFGMFIHFGLYAMPARHEWVKNYEEIPEDHYDLYFKHFNPDLYDPKEWARQAKAAGMKYVVMTTKHHEGFCLFDSGRFQQLLLHGSFQFLVECIRTAAEPNPPRLVINNLKLHYASASSHASVSLIPACSLASQQISCASSFIFWKAAFASFCSFMPFARPETAS